MSAGAGSAGTIYCPDCKLPLHLCGSHIADKCAGLPVKGFGPAWEAAAGELRAITDGWHVTEMELLIVRSAKSGVDKLRFALPLLLERGAKMNQAQLAQFIGITRENTNHALRELRAAGDPAIIAAITGIDRGRPRKPRPEPALPPPESW